jgi:CP family cyanate transporter-like MFS transporter
MLRSPFACIPPRPQHVHAMSHVAHRLHEDDHPLKYRWGMLALVWLAYATFGLATRAVAPLVTPIVRDLGLSHTQMGLVLGGWQAAYVVFAIIAGRILDRWGVRRAILLGAGIVAISLSARYWVGSFVPLLCSVALLGVGGPLISIGSPKMVSAWFQGRERGIAVGAYATGPFAGSLVALSATHTVVMPLAGGSWRAAFLIYGAFALVVSGLWMLAARELPGGPGGQEDKAGTVAVVGALLKLRDVRFLLVMGICSFAVVHGLGSWLPKMLESSGVSQGGAGILASLPVVSGLLAAMTIPRMVPPRRRTDALAVSAALTVGLLAAMPHVAGIALVAALAAVGATTGTFLPLEMLMLMETPGVQARVMGSAGGVFFCVAEIGGISGPLLVGALSDASGGFDSGMYALAGIGAVIAATGRMAARSHRRPSGDR